VRREKKDSNQSKRKAATIGSTYFYPPRTTRCTLPFSRFLSEYHANLDSFFFVIKVVAKADEDRVRASTALKSVARNDEERAEYEKASQDTDLVLRKLKEHSSVQSKNLTNGSVSAFQRYFSGIIQAAAHKRPEMLASAQSVRLDDILKFSRHKDLVAFIIDKKVNELAYGGLNEMEKYFDERLGIKMFDHERERNLLRLFIEARNINVHNGGIVNELFATRVGNVDGHDYALGKRFHIDFEALESLSENAMRVAMKIDDHVSAKFRLKRQSHSSWTIKK